MQENNLDIPENSLEQAIQKVYNKIVSRIDFTKALWDRSPREMKIKPRIHQGSRIYEVTVNGAKRVLCADTTSAGKTLTAIVVKGLMDEKYELMGHDKKAKAIVIAPNQAIASAWLDSEISEYTRALRLPEQRSISVENKKDLDEAVKNLDKYDFIMVNYDKFGISQKSNAYLSPLMGILPKIDLIIVDECHNLKNISANRSKAFRELIEKTKDKKFLMLSASPIPNRLKDAGFLLYMFDPDKYRHYAENEFDYSQDRFSIRNAIYSGNWFTFSREDLKALFGLPDLRFGIPELDIKAQHEFEISEDDAKKYFEEWKRDDKNVSKIAPLSKILLQSEFSEIEKLCEKIKKAEPNSQIGIYSFYKTGFSEELKQMLSRRFGGKVEAITGDIDDIKQRLEIAKRFRNGEINILVNTISTVSESISLVTGDRPSYVIFAEPPLVPANYEQAIGRFYRIGQKAPVTVIEIVPKNKNLDQMMVDEVEKRKAEGIKARASWKPGTVFENKHDIRIEKEKVLDKVYNGFDIGDLAEIADLSDEGEDEKVYTSIPKKEEEKKSNINEKFNECLKKARAYIGKRVEALVNSDGGKVLHDAYSSDEIAVTSSGDTNRAIAEFIQTLEQGTGRSLKKILDWGCGTACLARALKRPVYNLDAMKEMVITGKEKYPEAHFAVGNARNMPFLDKSFDIVSSSYAIQYNQQGHKHARDIEEIMLETNRVLKDKGYGILALANQATSPEDLRTFEKELLPSYGFRVLFKDKITGHAKNEETNRKNRVFQGVYLIVYQKTGNADKLNPDKNIFIYSQYKKVIGGTREREIEENSQKSCYKKEKSAADIFMTSGKVELKDAINEMIVREGLK